MRLLSSLGFIFLWPFTTASQDLSSASIKVDKPPKSVYFKTNPFAMLQGPIPAVAEYRFAFEAVASHRLTYQVGASYLNKSLLFSAFYPDTLGLTAKDFEFPGYRLQAQARYYFLKFNSSDKLSSYLLPSGAYLSLHTSYSAATFKLKAFSYPRIEWANFNINLLMGTQMMIEDYAGIDFFFGLGYKHNTITEFDHRMKKSHLDPGEVVWPYYGNALKVTLGFNFVFGLL